MVFNHSIRIKAMVNKFNQVRRQEGFPLITFSCEMYADGRWSVDLCIERQGCFFSKEMKLLFTLAQDNGLMFFVGSNQVSPILYFQ